MRASGAQLGVATQADLDRWCETAQGLVTATCGFWQLNMHLVKWAAQTGRIPLLVRYEDQSRWRNAVLRINALIFGREPQAVLTEAERYVA